MPGWLVSLGRVPGTRTYVARRPWHRAPYWVGISRWSVSQTRGTSCTSSSAQPRSKAARVRTTSSALFRDSSFACAPVHTIPPHPVAAPNPSRRSNASWEILSMSKYPRSWVLHCTPYAPTRRLVALAPGDDPRRVELRDGGSFGSWSTRQLPRLQAVRRCGGRSHGARRPVWEAHLYPRSHQNDA